MGRPGVPGVEPGVLRAVPLAVPVREGEVGVILRRYRRHSPSSAAAAPSQKNHSSTCCPGETCQCARSRRCAGISWQYCGVGSVDDD